MRKQYYVYILSNKYKTVFYTGMCSDLIRRLYEHKNKLVEGFTKRYNISDLLYYESTDNPESAILREKQIKDYRRNRKLELIQGLNPTMMDLSCHFDPARWRGRNLIQDVPEKGGDLSLHSR